MSACSRWQLCRRIPSAVFALLRAGLQGAAEAEVSVLEELALPEVEQAGRDAEVVADLRDGDILKEVAHRSTATFS